MSAHDNLARWMVRDIVVDQKLIVPVLLGGRLHRITLQKATLIRSHQDSSSAMRSGSRCFKTCSRVFVICCAIIICCLLTCRLCLCCAMTQASCQLALVQASLISSRLSRRTLSLIAFEPEGKPRVHTLAGWTRDATRADRHAIVGFHGYATKMVAIEPHVFAIDGTRHRNHSHVPIFNPSATPAAFSAMAPLLFSHPES